MRRWEKMNEDETRMNEKVEEQGQDVSKEDYEKARSLLQKVIEQAAARRKRQRLMEAGLILIGLSLLACMVVLPQLALRAAACGAYIVISLLWDSLVSAC
ncbi:MAG: hypothetical protein NZ651_06585 [Candidatus Bipolaricaulota bacterium]|nr:hypothetical protein [Candidatus Bipolaricaulota bacterium]MDW8127420.1 hypothetical protein [Candidatus Bipolaricaulota bacterium]